MEQTKTQLTAMLKPGMIAAEDTYSDNNHLIFKKGTPLTAELISKLRTYTVRSVKIVISDGNDQTIPMAEPATPVEQTYFDRVKTTEEFKAFQQKFTNTLSAFENQLNDIVVKNSANAVEDMLQGLNALLTRSRNPLHLLDMIQCMRGFDDSTYAHSLNVSLICNVIGSWLHLSTKDMHILKTAGMLHDIGKLKIPHDIIKKPGRLTEEEFHMIQSHPAYGYEILKDKPLDNRIKLAAYQHHEKYNGKGYPNHLAGDQIDFFASIVTVADVYDAMTADRCYRKGICPFTVIATLAQEQDMYNPNVLYTFMQRTVEAYINTEVRLSNGEKGRVILLNKSVPSRPMVMTTQGLHDLAKESDLHITELL